MVLGKHETAQFRPEVTINAGRQPSRYHVAIRRLPAFAAEIDDVRTDHQILHREARVAFEAGAPGWGQCDGPFLVNRKLRPRTASHALPLATASRWLRLGRPLHAARSQGRPTRTTLAARNLGAQ